MQGKVVVITGASQGIGAASARVFAKAGARVVLLARSEAAIAALAREIGQGALAIVCDVGDETSVSAAMARVVAECGGLDVLIGNAGVIDPIGRICDVTAEDWPARLMLWMCGPGGDDWLGQEVSMRDEAVRRAVGLGV